MIKYFGRLIIFLGLLYANSAVADPLLDKFYGKYTGFGTLQTSSGAYYMNTPRDFDLEILPLAPNGFRIEWTTIKHKGSNPNELTPEISEQSSEFLPAAKRGTYHAMDSGDFLHGGVASWARVNDDWLTIYRLVVGDDGIPEMHIYRRVLQEKGLELRFSAIRDGKEIRTVTGRYRKQ